MDETWCKSVEEGLAKLGGQSNLQKLYSTVKRRREELGLSIPKEYKAVIRKELEYNSSDSSNWKGGKDLFYSVKGIGGGIWGLSSALPTIPTSLALTKEELDGFNIKKQQTVFRILRNTKIVKKLKVLHNHSCQICGQTIHLGEDRMYSEGHHIRPLGSPHEGPDIAGNILIVCPNHHVLLDYGAIKISKEKLRVIDEHELSDRFIDYHNNVIYIGNSIP